MMPSTSDLLCEACSTLPYQLTFFPSQLARITVALAFLLKIAIDKSAYPVVLDTPITSRDHRHRNLVASGFLTNQHLNLLTISRRFNYYH